MNPVELADDTVRLRLPVERDIDPIYRACQDAENQRWLSALPHPYRREDAQHFVHVIVPAGWVQGPEPVWAIADAGDDALLGTIGLHDHLRDDAVAGVGLWVAPWARQRGVATAATRLVAGWCFAELGLRRLEWYAYVGNDASWRVAEKVGFTREGTLRSRLVHRGSGARHDTWLGGLLPGELR